MNKVGRPVGRHKTDKIEVMIEHDKKQKFIELARQNGSNASVEINKMISDYLDRNTKEGRESLL